MRTHRVAKAEVGDSHARTHFHSYIKIGRKSKVYSLNQSKLYLVINKLDFFPRLKSG